MARDFILGRTKRRWGRSDLGSFPTVSRATDRERYEDIRAHLEVPALAKTVEAEIQQNYHHIVRLVTSKQMPVAERKSFGKLLARWQEFSTPRTGKWSGADYVALVNFRDANRRVTARLAELDRTAPAAEVPGQPGPTAPSTMRMIAGIALGAAGVYASYKLREHIHNR